MIFISHRGNLDGFNPKRENSPEYIEEALEEEYSVMIDVWLIAGIHPALGNDHPQYPVDLGFLQKKGLICRARTLQALQYLLDNNIHCFHQDYERLALTNEGWVWTTDNHPVVPRSIYHLPENHVANIEASARLSCTGVCSNFIKRVAGRLDESSDDDTSSSEGDCSGDEEDVEKST